VKKLIVSIAAFFGISSMVMTSCQEHLPQELQQKVEEKQDEVAEAVGAELKKALISQMDEFLQSDDLQESLGFTENQLSEIEQSVEQYINEYEFDTEALLKVTDELQLLFKEAKGLSKEEIQKELDEILNN